MRKTSKLLLLLLALTLSLSLFACGGGDDGDDDGGDNPPATSVAEDLELITDGVANFRVVLGEKIPTDVRKAVDLELIQVMKREHNIEVVSAQMGSSNDVPQEIEVLIGDVTNRGDKYIYDRYQFGNEGYMIKIIDNINIFFF